MIVGAQIGYLGQLGNQMFQFATLAGVGYEKGFEFRIPVTNTKKHGIVHDDNLGKNINYGLSLLECFIDLEKYCEYPEKIGNLSNIYRENQHEFNSNIFDITDNTFIIGYFETEKYFLNHQDKIRELYKFNQDVLEISKKRIQEYKNKNNKKLLSLHIRRGQDRPSAQSHHPWQSKSYYDEALSNFDLNEYTVVVFTDDFKWAKENINVNDVIFSEWYNDYHRPDFIDLCMMTMCDAHIIANSTFSWWGAWLSKPINEQKVIAPKLWFGPALSNKNTNDIIPNRWKRI